LNASYAPVAVPWVAAAFDHQNSMKKPGPTQEQPVLNPPYKPEKEAASHRAMNAGGSTTVLTPVFSQHKVGG